MAGVSCLARITVHAHSDLQEYVDNQLVGTGCCSSAVIIGHDGSVWAQSPQVKVSTDNALSLVRGFSNPASLTAAGATLNGRRYIVVRADERTAIGSSGQVGFVAVKTGQCVLIGFHNETIKGAVCSVRVESLADYLIENGY